MVSGQSMLHKVLYYVSGYKYNTRDTLFKLLFTIINHFWRTFQKIKII